MSRYYAKLAFAGDPIPLLLERWVAFSLDWSLTQDDPAKALLSSFLLQGGTSGRPRKRERDFLLYKRMKELIDGGMAVLEAGHICSEEFSLHESNVQKICYKYKTHFDDPPF